MPFITWDDCYSVHIPEMDEEHKIIIKIINQLDDVIKDGKDQYVIGDIINQLIEYTITHFSNEEKLMAGFGFPELEKHKRIHSSLCEQARIFLNEYNSGKSISAEKLMKFLWEWLLDHIMGDDKKYGQFYTKINTKNQETQEVLIK